MEKKEEKSLKERGNRKDGQARAQFLVGEKVYVIHEDKICTAEVLSAEWSSYYFDTGYMKYRLKVNKDDFHTVCGEYTNSQMFCSMEQIVDELLADFDKRNKTGFLKKLAAAVSLVTGKYKEFFRKNS